MQAVKHEGVKHSLQKMFHSVSRLLLALDPPVGSAGRAAGWMMLEPLF
jgi:hypothetical protein